MVIINGKIVGGTLVESVISMTLILLITALVFSFFIRINTSNINELRMEAFLLSKSILSDIQENHYYYNDQLILNNLNVKQQVTSLDKENGVFLVCLEFKDQKNRTIYRYSTISVDNPLLLISE